ncbi:hypothetical protein [Chromobacterium sp. IIBBL 290-4]|uniref:hypothetical protein n=1 Tax=Chromobacterium sp. IIBBL 290-4 TaxID=2953890 RepID=UPI0020B65E13|nr:hypothetical protein [Chromobacterium sp. IIBBL 290-4]UTH76476.1 hypothetical protein NKT35_10395 [Chromobacterium sp. IIBBL 290-4]
MKPRSVLLPLLLVPLAAVLLFQVNHAVAGIAASPLMIAAHLMLAALLLLPLWLNKVWLGNALAVEGWPAIQARGKARFILIFGVLGRGVPLTLFIFGMSSVAQSKPALSMGPALLFWLLLGAWFAHTQWRQLERANKTQDKQ